MILLLIKVYLLATLEYKEIPEIVKYEKRWEHLEGATKIKNPPGLCARRVFQVDGFQVDLTGFP